MDEKRKIDLQKHQLQPVSKRYLWRIVIYVVLLIGVSLAIYYVGKNAKDQAASSSSVDEIEEVHNITLE